MLRSLFNYKVIIAAIIFALVVFAALLGVLWSAKAPARSPAPATAVLNIIQAPTVTPPQPVTTPTPTLEPTKVQATPPPSGNIKVGDYVQVSGTEGDGLRLHTSAGVTSKVNYVAIESEVLLVKDGPIDSDGYVWWSLQDPYTQDAVGWGVSNYLVVVKNP